MSDPTDRIRAYVLKVAGLPDDLSNDEDLIESGRVDSVTFLQIMSFVENELGVAINPDDGDDDNLDGEVKFMTDNFRSIASISRMVERSWEESVR